MFERVLRGGRVVDGSGAPARVADVALDGGRIAAVGESLGPARESVDVSGRIVCPGFVDLHTHFDAQVFWDPQLSPAPLHGVTSVVGGNCGFSIAPLAPEAGDYLMRMLARVEGMPLESLAEGVPWDWSSFGDYLARIEARGVAVNAGFLVGHSALRRVVMGSAAVGEEASPQQLAAMQELLARSLAEGGLGFSSSWAQTHNDGDGKPVPSRFASREELLALASVLREHPGTALEFLPGVARFDEERMDLMASLSLAAERPLNWNVLGVSSFSKGHEHQLSASDYAAQRGATVVALTPSQNMTLRLNLV